MGSTYFTCYYVHGSVRRHSIPNLNHLTTSLSSTFNPFLRELKKVPWKIDVSKTIKNTSQRLLDEFVDSTFKFMKQPTLPSQANFAPVEEIGEAVKITSIEGEIPADFHEGIYIRNGSNPLFGALQSTVSALGQSSSIWVEGEGMLHALYFSRDAASGGAWAVSYKNRYVESDTFRLERRRGRPCFLPAIEGDSPAILAAHVLNQLRFGKVNKYISNTNVFEHSGRLYSVAENHIPQEIDIHSLDTFGNWDVSGAWDRPFTAHPKRAPGSGELVITGADARKPFLVLGVISADGKKLIHKADVKLERSIICHDIGVTEKYNIILDMPLTIDVNRLIRGGPLIKFEKESYARIGVMPRYGDADSIKWFEVEPYCIFHLVNCYEDGDEVVVRGFQAPESIVPGPDFGLDKFEWFSRGFNPSMRNKLNTYNLIEGFLLSRLYEWRLDMKSGIVKGRYLMGTDLPADFPMINEHLTGLYNKFAYAQVVNTTASSICAMPKYGSLAKFFLAEEVNGSSKEKNPDDLIKVEFHPLGRDQFCSGAAFVPKCGSHEEDDGWIISFVHNEETDVSQVHIIDTKKFEDEPVAKITLPQRVPYGFHGTFITTPTQH